MVRFKVVTTSYNCADYIGRCLQSLEEQTYTNFNVCVVDDASTDPRQRPIIESYCKRNNWKAIFNKTNRKGMATMIQAIEALECEDEDVLVIVDGDDWLYDEGVLEYVKRVYIEQKVLLTYGQSIFASNGTLGISIPTKKRWIRKRLYRKQAHWILSHLRTFKYILWHNIRDEDLRDRNGYYLNRASDMATMYPMAEMAGNRVAHIDRVLYVYNDLNPINDFKLYRPLQLEQGNYIYSLPRYKPLKSLGKNKG